jgi:hypothetical protein
MKRQAKRNYFVANLKLHEMIQKRLGDHAVNELKSRKMNDAANVKKLILR